MPEWDVMIIDSSVELLLKVRVRFSNVVEKSTGTSQVPIESNCRCDPLRNDANMAEMVDEWCAPVFRAFSKYVFERVHLLSYDR